VRAAIGRVLCSFFLVQEQAVLEQAAQLRIEKLVGIEEESDGGVGFERVVDDAALFAEVGRELHEFAELKGPGVVAAALHDIIIHDVEENLGHGVVFPGGWVDFGVVPGFLEDCVCQILCCLQWWNNVINATNT